MVTIIIPTYNEENNIRPLEENLRSLKGDFEVIFSDGFSKDKTYDLITFKKIRKTKYRSNQMNEGAKYAQGDYLFFLHADSKIGKEAILKIEESGHDAGCFTIKFFPENLKMKLIAKGSNKRVKRKNIAFGDQGIFIKKDLFESIGGYPALPLMEDYALSLNLGKRGIKIGQLDYPIYSSSRRFIKGREFRTIIQMQKLQKRFLRGESIEKIAQAYKKIGQSKEK
jgi:rSAM/selenodomain-associated transferase 2